MSRLGPSHGRSKPCKCHGHVANQLSMLCRTDALRTDHRDPLKTAPGFHNRADANSSTARNDLQFGIAATWTALPKQVCSLPRLAGLRGFRDLHELSRFHVV